MERLTERNPSWIDDELWESACEPDCEEIDAVYRKLKDYEDLEERLNKVYGDCDGLLLRVVEMLEKHQCVDMASNTLKSRLLTDEDVDKWEEYKQLEEQDRLIKLPCKVGDKIFLDFAGFGKDVDEFTVVDFHLDCFKDGEVILFCDYESDDKTLSGQIDVMEFGKTVFLTKSEAEAKLKELRGRENESNN